MPVQKCQQNGVSGWRWGKSGKCYTGPDAKKKATKQGQAIQAQSSHGSRMRELLEDIEKVLAKK